MPNEMPPLQRRPEKASLVRGRAVVGCWQPKLMKIGFPDSVSSCGNYDQILLHYKPYISIIYTL